MPSEKSAGAVIFYRQPDGQIEYLLLKHNERYWNFPKGRIEAGEDSLAAARREVEEETGLKAIIITPGFKVYNKYFFKKPQSRSAKKNKTIFKIVTFFLARARSQDVKVSHEHQGYAWFKFKEASKLLKKYKSSQKVLTRAHNFLTDKRHDEFPAKNLPNS